MTKEEKIAASHAVGLEILCAVKKLKPHGIIFPQKSIPMEFYLLDDEYDVALRVWLIPKKSQEQIGKEMFE